MSWTCKEPSQGSTKIDNDIQVIMILFLSGKFFSTWFANLTFFFQISATGKVFWQFSKVFVIFKQIIEKQVVGEN